MSSARETSRRESEEGVDFPGSGCVTYLRFILPLTRPAVVVSTLRTLRVFHQISLVSASGASASAEGRLDAPARGSAPASEGDGSNITLKATLIDARSINNRLEMEPLQSECLCLSPSSPICPPAACGRDVRPKPVLDPGKGSVQGV